MDKVEFLKQYLLRDPISKNAAYQALKDWDKLPLYAFKYSPGLGRYWVTLSIHRTKEGAEMAMALHRHDCNGIEYPRNQHPNWKVEEIQIQD